MKRSYVLLVVAIIGVLAIAFMVMGGSKDTPQNNAPEPSHGNNQQSPSGEDEEAEQQDLTNQTEVTMDIKEFAFEKANIKIKKGTKVTWTNRDDAGHNAFSDDTGGPKGTLLDQGASYSFTFETVGTVNYYCEPHPYMKGVVEVVE